MWRRFCSSGNGILKRTVLAAVGTSTAPSLPTPLLCSAGGKLTTPSSSSAYSFFYGRQGGAAAIFPTLSFSSSPSSSSSSPPPPPSSSSCNSNTDHRSTKKDKNEEEEKKDENINKKNNNNTEITCAEAKRLMRLVNVEALKMRLGMEAKEVISYTDLLEACQSIGITRSLDEAVAFARILDDAGVVLLFRDKVYLHPDKVVDLIRRAVPLALTPDDDPCRYELKRLQQKKEEIDVLAHKQVRRILWCGLGLALFQVGLFFRLTFWEFSWDVMEPIAFFATTSSIVIGYAYFLITARDPTYQDLMKRLFLSRQRKLFKKQNFEIERFKELQAKCKTPLDATASIRNRVGMELELEDAPHRY